MASVIQCPACGGDVSIASKASKTAACPYCDSTLIVNQAAIEAQGKLALLADTPSCLAVGWRAELAGTEVHVLGRIQYRYDAGYWDEWWVHVPQRDQYAWISQDEGEYMLEVPLGKDLKAPDYDAVNPGDVVHLGKHRLWVEEKNTADMVGMQGELPLDAAPGRTMRYLDLTDNKIKATAEYFEDGSVQLFQGRYLKPRDLKAVTDGPVDSSLPEGTRPPPALPHPQAHEPLGLPGVTRTEEGVKPQSVSCTNCGGSVTVRSGEGGAMVVCEHCGAALDVAVPGTVRLLYMAKKGRIEFPIEIGAAGTIRGVQYTAIGRVDYEQRDEGIYRWQALQLYNPKHGYAFLELENGHWMFYSPLRHPVQYDPRYAAPGQSFRHRGQRYKVYERGDCKITYVEGELTWVARVGDRVNFMDATRPPYMLSAEWTDREIEWEMGVYMTPAEVCAAFKLPAAKRTRPSGVAPAQPFDRSKSRFVAMWAGLAAGVLLLVLGAFAWMNEGEPALPMQTIASNEYLSEAGYVSPDFEIPEGGHVCRLDVSAGGLSNAWVAFAIALIDAEDERILLDVDTAVERYHGRTGGESWTEGSTSDYALFRLQGPRTYRINVFGQTGGWSQSRGDFAKARGPTVRLAVHRGVTPARYYLFAAVLALLFPIWEIARQVMHKSRQSPETDD